MPHRRPKPSIILGAVAALAVATPFAVTGLTSTAPEIRNANDTVEAVAPDIAEVVLASVPGTAQAQEALIQAQIPQQVTVTHAEAKLDVPYAGAPKFQPIAGTQLAYATNTSFDVVRAGGAYYACYHAAVALLEECAGVRRERWDHPEVHRLLGEQFARRGLLLTPAEVRAVVEAGVVVRNRDAELSAPGDAEAGVHDRKISLTARKRPVVADRDGGPGIARRQQRRIVEPRAELADRDAHR